MKDESDVEQTHAVEVWLESRQKFRAEVFGGLLSQEGFILLVD